MKTTFISTVFNEEKTISIFIKSVLSQTKKIDEIIIVDGGSSDATISIISNFKSQILNKKIKFQLLKKKGNRSVGRNLAIKKAAGNIILIADAGTRLDKEWAKHILEPFKEKSVDVVSGYYKGVAKNIFQKCLIPYVLVMPDKINNKQFLPATRSMAIKKNIWEKLGGFNERLSHNEDYAFAQKIKKVGASIAFSNKAIVYWYPRKNLAEAFIMFFRFALGDSEARILRPKVIFIFIRYLAIIILLLTYYIFKSYLIISFIFFMGILYIFWSIKKNYRYVKHWMAIVYWPSIQIVSDIAIILGTIIGIYSLKRYEN